MNFSLITPAEGRERDAAHEWAAGPYAEHQWLWRFFPAPEGTRRDFLFRRRDADGVPRFYIVSKRAPVTQGTAWDIRTRDYNPTLEVGSRLRFDLRANPVVTHSREGKRKRHDVVMEAKKQLLKERGLAHWQDWKDDQKPALYALVREACGTWLLTRAPRLGFEVDLNSLAVNGYQQHSEKEGDLTFSTVDFSGELIVSDTASFSTTLREGIGPAKAFGCGLLLVRRT
jgi:CRISPR system Cascade subunit CasE